MEMDVPSQNVQVKPMSTGATSLQVQFQNKEDIGLSQHLQEKATSQLADVEEVYGKRSQASLKWSNKAQGFVKEKQLCSRDLIISSCRGPRAGRLKAEGGGIFDERQS